MYLTEELQKKWAPVLEHEGLEAIKDPYKKLLQHLFWKTNNKLLQESAQQLNETTYSATPGKRCRWCF
jgi:hypothetical protein